MDRQYKTSLLPRHLLRRTLAIFIIPLLMAPSTAAQALSGTEKSDRLSGLANEAEQKAYCYYTTTVNVQLARLLPGKSTSDNQATDFAQWQTVFQKAAASDPALIEASSRITQYFDQLVSRYRQETSANKFSAMAAIASQDRPFCQAVLEEMSQPQTAGKPPASVSSTPEVVEAPQPPVNPWRKFDFSGSWQTSGQKTPVSYINRIQLVLWDSGDGTPEGLAAFVGQGRRCLGAVESRADLDALHVLPIEGGLCRESSDKGYFQLVSKAQDTLMKLAFIPGLLDSYQQEEYLKRGVLQLEKLPEVPARLQPYVQDIEPDSLSMKERIVQRGKQHKERLDALTTTLANGFKDHFSDARLMGNWRGEIHDKRRAYQAEMVIWSSNPQRLQQLVGLLRFDDTLCTMAFLITPAKDRVYLRMDSGLGKRPVQPCTKANGSGTFMLNDAAKTMAIFTTAVLGSVDGVGSEQCLTGLVSSDVGDCFSAGLFQRMPASPKMKQAIHQFAWGVVKAPSPETWEALQNNTTELVKLQTQHLRAIENNSQILAQINEESEQRQRRYDEALERQRQERREESTRHTYASNSATPSRGNRTGQGILKSPVITGPFDGLRGASFFNALYRDDAKSVRQITQAYQEQKIRRRKEAMGNQPHMMDGILDSSVRKIRLTSVFLAVYLLNYDTVYKSCLKDEAVKFVVTRETPDTITYNTLGWEVSRSYGHIDRKYYTVNKEFTDALLRVGKMNIGKAGLWNSIENMLTNNSKPDMLAGIMAGTKQMMAKFKCDAAEIKQLERNVLDIYFAKNSP